MALFQSPPGSGGNDGAIPVIYDPGWPAFTNLTPSQILAFQSFPQDLHLYLQVRRQLAEWSGITIGGSLLDTTNSGQNRLLRMIIAFDKGVAASQPFYDANGNLHVITNAQGQAIYNAFTSFVVQTFQTAKTTLDGINASPATITTRKQIDAAIAAIAPNSPSATNPSPT